MVTKHPYSRTNQKTSSLRCEYWKSTTMENKISSKFSMASCATSSSGTTGSKKRLPEELTELLDVAIYTFACQAGLRAGHKVRGNPVLEGVSAFFGQLIETANEDTKKQLKDISPGRLGGWQPGEAPSPQLLTLVSSRIKLMKSKQLIREDEEEERVRTKTLARCWRCQSRCRFCLRRRHDFPKFGHFRPE